MPYFKYLIQENNIVCYTGYHETNKDDQLWAFLNTIYDGIASNDCWKYIPFEQQEKQIRYGHTHTHLTHACSITH